MLYQGFDVWFYRRDDPQESSPYVLEVCQNVIAHASEHASPEGWLLVSLQQQPVMIVVVGSGMAAFGGSLGASLVYWLSRRRAQACLEC